MKTLMLCGILLGLLFSAPGQADVRDSRDQLQQIRKRIERTAADLGQQKSAEKELLRDLSVVATSIKQLDKRIASIKQQKEQNAQQLNDARLELKKAQKQLGDLETMVNRRLVALYKEGETGPLKVLFSSDTPMELVQEYQYLSRILGHDRQLLAEFRVLLARQRDKQLHLERLQHEQQRLLDSEQKKREDAAEARVLYSQILKRVRKDKTELSRELNELEARARRLEKLLKQLESERTQLPAAPQGDFATLKGRLPWPIEGSVAVGFGTRHNDVPGSLLESHGIEIDYKAAAPVRAVAHGRIVFASWFKGYGNLMIVAHDGGYHTLYAQAERLEGSVGDVVAPGAVIARSGPPHGQGLYFEIRRNGAPLDPLLWLKSD